MIVGMKRWFKIGSPVLALLFALLQAFIANAAEPKVLNIGWTGGTAWTALPDRIATERGFFEKEGLRVRYIQFQGTNLMLSALMANELDYVTILPFIAGARRIFAFGFKASAMQLSASFASPFASFARQLAVAGATSNRSASSAN